ncbi:MAG: electron transfer flavoprotein subunit beta/FixA family protein [Clostridia bacterium]|nr:electron transfer flavoprotein subunit beta/FixA family protein [Clostridia bacterium]
MNIIVCVKQVPGTNKVAVDPVTGVLIRDGVDSKINPYDLFALEEGFSLAEKTDGCVKTLSMGPPQAKEALKETLWMGASESVLLSDRKFGGADVAATSCALALGIKKLGEYDIIICGKQTTDGDTAQVGPELAQRLGIEHIANVTEILECRDGYITVTADLDTVIQTAKIKLPCLITIEKDANTPRLPSYNRKKSMDCDELIKVYSVADIPDADENMLGLKGSPTQVERIFPPEKNSGQEISEGSSDELCDKLFELLSTRKFI